MSADSQEQSRSHKHEPDQKATGFTPMPNWLIDTTMPSLTDTEWRVLCVVVRQTLGWIEKRPVDNPVENNGEYRWEERKRRDWLTQSQLKRRTGRASEAVSRAITSLVRRQLLIVEDGGRTLLRSPLARRANHSRLYYRLNDQPEAFQYSVSEHAKPNRTKETFNKKIYRRGQNIQFNRFSKQQSSSQSLTRRDGWTKISDLLH